MPNVQGDVVMGDDPTTGEDEQILC